MPHRYFTGEIGGGRAALTGADAHHLAHVMRAHVGDTVLLCGPDALEYTGTVVSIGEGRVEFTVSEGLPSTAEPRCEVTLYAAYPKQGKLEEIIRHGVALGAARVIPFFRAAIVWPRPKKRTPKTSATGALPPRPPSSAGAAGCRRSRCRGRTLPPCAPSLPAYDLVLFFYEGRRAAAAAAAGGRNAAAHCDCDRQRGRVCPRGSRAGRSRRGGERRAGAAHPALRDRAAGRTGRRADR